LETSSLCEAAFRPPSGPHYRRIFALASTTDVLKLRSFLKGRVSLACDHDLSRPGVIHWDLAALSADARYCNQRSFLPRRLHQQRSPYNPLYSSQTSLFPRSRTRSRHGRLPGGPSCHFPGGSSR